MGDLFDVTHEGGTLGEYDGTVVDGGDLSVDPAAAIRGNYGLKCLIDDQTEIYGMMLVPWPASNQLRIRFYYNADAWVPGGNVVTYLTGSDWMATSTLCPIRIQRVGATNKLVVYASHDAGSDLHNHDPIGAGDHCIEVHIERAATDVSSDGRVRWWVDGALIKTFSNVDNYDHLAYLDELRLGAMSVGVGITGAIYFDNFKANDDGSEIGPVPETVDGIRTMAMGMVVVGT